MGGHLRCWECGQQLDTGDVERRAKRQERADLILTLVRDSDAHRTSGRHEAADALEALATELDAAPLD